MSPLLSICIPTYNRASLLELTLENILAQTAGLPDVEVVVSDNASPDHTPEVLARFPGLVTDRLERTVGVTRNIEHVACDLATGDYVWLVGDDDLVIAGALPRLLAFLRTNPDLGYVYLNFGWIEATARERVIRDLGSVPEVSAATPWQFQDFTSRRLARLEDLVHLPCSNPSTIFSLMMCFVARREMFLQRWSSLRPSDSLDGSSVLMDDSLPHGKVVVEHFAGQPIGYIGEPCFLQGLNAWLWKGYAIKCNLFGIGQFLTWLEGSAFDAEAAGVMRASFHTMAGSLFAQMVADPEEHLGMDLVLQHVVQPAVLHDGFWAGFREGQRQQFELAAQVEFLVEEARSALDARAATDLAPRIGVWGVSGPGERVIQALLDLGQTPVWVGDRTPASQGRDVPGTGLRVSAIESLPGARLDLLIIAVKRSRLDQIRRMEGLGLGRIRAIVTLRGTFAGEAFPLPE